MKSISTARLYLQEMHVDDQEVLLRLIEDHEVQSIYYEGVESLKKMVNNFDAYQQSNKRIWTIRPKSEESKGIGICMIDHWDEINRTFEIEGVLLSMYWNRHIMAEALRALMQHIESRRVIHAFVCRTAIFNERAIRLAEQLGFHKVGSLDHELILGRTTSIIAEKSVETPFLHA